MEKYFINYF